MESNKTILIKGAVGNRNFGDDFLLFAISLYLSKHGNSVDFAAHSSNDYIIKSIKDISLRRLESYSDVFLIIYAGGTQFATFESSYQRLIRKISILRRCNPFKIFYRIFKNRQAQSKLQQHVPVILVGIGIGPFKKGDRYFRGIMSYLRKSEFIAVRDVLSSQICTENSIKHIMGADLVFSIPENFWEKFTNNNHCRVKSIAIIVRDWDYESNSSSYIDSLKDFRIPGVTIDFFSFCVPKDVKSITKVVKYHPTSKVVDWNPEIDDFEHFITMLCEYDLIITARYHGAVVATLLNIPFISIGIEPKLRMVAEQFEMPVWGAPYSLNDLYEYIELLSGNYSGSTEKIKKVVLTEREKAAKMMDELDDQLKRYLKLI